MKTIEFPNHIIKNFNTGRLYDKRGQLIFWEIIEKTEDGIRILFYDTSRGITKFIDLESDFDIKYWLMKSYDNGEYDRGHSQKEYFHMMDFEKEINEFLKTINEEEK